MQTTTPNPPNPMLRNSTIPLPSPNLVTPDQWEVISLLGAGDVALGLHLILDAGMQRIAAQGGTMTLRRDLSIWRDHKLHLLPTPSLAYKYGINPKNVTQILRKMEARGTPV